jgi:hypothetical protein
MPSNKVQINGSEKHVWEVPDTHMEKLLSFLNGIKDKIERAEPGVAKNVPDLIHSIKNLEREYLDYCDWKVLAAFEYELDVMKAKVTRRKTVQSHK